LILFRGKDKKNSQFLFRKFSILARKILKSYSENSQIYTENSQIYTENSQIYTEKWETKPFFLVSHF